jgi:hypothetical protein
MRKKGGTTVLKFFLQKNFFINNIGGKNFFFFLLSGCRVISEKLALLPRLSYLDSDSLFWKEYKKYLKY